MAITFVFFACATSDNDLCVFWDSVPGGTGFIAVWRTLIRVDVGILELIKFMSADISVLSPRVRTEMTSLLRRKTLEIIFLSSCAVGLTLAFRHMREQGREGNVAGWMKTPVLVGIADRQPIVGLKSNTVPVA